jgi:uncharacterized membrane protein
LGTQVDGLLAIKAAPFRHDLAGQPARAHGYTSRMSTRVLLAAIVYLCVVHALAVVMTARSLPLTVASHFNFSGAADAHLERDAYAGIMVAIGVSLIVLLFLLVWLATRLPRSMVNIPRRDYWLSEEVLPVTKAYLNLFALRVALVTILYLNVANLLVIEANKITPPRLEPIPFSVALAVYVLCMAGFVIALVRHFRQGRGDSGLFNRDLPGLAGERGYESD